MSLILGTWLLAFLVLAISHRVDPFLKNILQIILVYFCISVRSLEDAAMDVKQALAHRDIHAVRKKVAMIVGRDINHYDQEGLSRATVETVAENLVDGVIAPLFFAAIGGASLAMAYKMANTLDSMVGYKNKTYEQFGKASARIDDVLNFIPARLSIPTIALAAQILPGSGKRSLKTAVCEGRNHSSPNAGYPEAAFAGALALKLSGPNFYNGIRVNKPYIGVRFGPTSPAHIKKACDLMMLASCLWLLVVWAASLVIKLF